MTNNSFHLTVDEIITRLKKAREKTILRDSFHSTIPDDYFREPPRQAAVLVPLFREGKDWSVLYTRRNEALPEHSGQVAFPGGRSDADDRTPEETALREAYEELKILPQDVLILGQLPTLRTISNYCVTPVVGMIPWPYSFTLAPDEVSQVFSIPLRWLASKDNIELRQRELPAGQKPLKVVYFKPFQGELLWGVTAEITLTLLTVLGLIEI